MDKLYDKFSRLFNKYGEPKNFINKLGFNNEKLGVLNNYYNAYKLGILKQTIAINGIKKCFKIDYNNDFDKLINEIKQNSDAEVIYIRNGEINDLDKLEKLKEKFSSKEIILNWDNELIFIDDLIKVRYMLDYFKSLMDGLSTLEIVTLAYDIAKSNNYKEYSVKHTQKSRALGDIVNNNYIVCVGFVKLFNRILKESGLQCFELSLVLDGKTKVNHSRSIVKIVDEKYGVDGLFVFDPTFDSADKKHYLKANEDEIFKSRSPKDGYKEADSMSLYKYFLVDIHSYEAYFPNSIEEKILLPKEKHFDAERTHALLHKNQKGKMHLSIENFIILLYNVRKNEGYKDQIIPSIVQTLFLNGYGYYKESLILNTINKHGINDKTKKNF